MDTHKFPLRKLATACLGLALSASALAGGPPYDRIVTFGTSFSDPGNGFFILNSLTDPNSQQPCSNGSMSLPPYDTLDVTLVPDAPYALGGHHFSNGATWAENLARMLKKPGNAKPALKAGVSAASNFAVGGARTYAYDCRFNLTDQLAAFKSKGISTSKNTLFILEFGANDIRDALSDPANALNLLANGINNIGTAVGALYADGARQFLIANVPWVGETPAVQQLDRWFPALNIAASANFLTQQFNLGLQDLRTFLIASFPGIDVKILEQDVLLTEILDDPAAFGLNNTEEACVTPGAPPFKCKTPDTYLFWDGIHPTQQVHQAIAQRAYDTLGLGD